MRRLAVVLTILAALTFLGGICRIMFHQHYFGMGLLAVGGETYWRGAIGLLLFAIVVLMLERAQSR
jgi:hypothetical protein